MKQEYNPMFRYLNKYVGTYRVIAHYDLDTRDFPRDDTGTIDEHFDDMYIPCQKGLIKHTYDVEKLMWYCDSLGKGRNVKRDIDSKYGNKLPYQYEETSEEVMITFDAENMSKIAKIVNPKTAGKGIKPYSDKNLPAPEYKIPEADLEKYNAIIQKVPKDKRMVFSKEAVKLFDDVIKKSKGKRFNLEDNRSVSGLKPKVYIHYIGMWDEFVKFVENKVKSEGYK